MLFSPEVDINQNKREEETKNEEDSKSKILIKLNRNN